MHDASYSRWGAHARVGAGDGEVLARLLLRVHEDGDGRERRHEQRLGEVAVHLESRKKWAVHASFGCVSNL